MHLGKRPKVPFPATHGPFHLIRILGRVFAIPLSLVPDPDPEEKLLLDLIAHPDTLSASTLEEMQGVIDALDEDARGPRTVGHFEGYDLVRYHGGLYGVPAGAGTVDLGTSQECARAGVVRGGSRQEIEARIRRLAGTTPVEFAGWLPIYKVSGDCGRHPQFTHTADPPPGYRFTCSAPPRVWPRRSFWKRLGKGIQWLALGVFSCVRPLYTFIRPRKGVGVGVRLRIVGALLRQFSRFLRRGCRPFAILRFLQSRHLESQLLLGKRRELAFLTSMPYTFGQRPWVIEIEDPTTLFYPLIQNGNTCGLEIRASPYYPIVKALLEGDECKAVLTHMKSTARLVGTLFDSEAIRNKVLYAPLGVKLPVRWQRHEPQPQDEPIHLLFINSWCQVPANFYVRGGLDVLEAFAILHERYPQLRLTIRSVLPELDDHYHRILETGWVRVINRFMTAEEMAALHADSHLFLLPAARVHIVSLLQAMSYGLAVVASDGWGIEEYIDHERNGLIVKGRYGKTSWADEEAGLLRENYEPMYTAEPEVVQGIVEAVSRLVEDRKLRARLGRAARADVETKYTPEQWNRGLKAAFDRAQEGAAEPLEEAISQPSDQEVLVQ
ncbi:MAG: glycosyltransferase family 4 protein [Planctomycetes bacterium]|nr:glycosyltransferase family 4 protein [Planctomycetota bacterium]